MQGSFTESIAALVKGTEQGKKKIGDYAVRIGGLGCGIIQVGNIDFLPAQCNSL